MTAANAVTVLAGGTEQLARAVLDIVPYAALGVAALVVLALYWRTRVRRRPAEAEEIGDDVIGMIREAREQDRAEAQADADFERELDEWVRRYGRG